MSTERRKGERVREERNERCEYAAALNHPEVKLYPCTQIFESNNLLPSCVYRTDLNLSFFSPSTFFVWPINTEAFAYSKRRKENINRFGCETDKKEIT